MLRAGLIGTGYWGPNLANAIERTGEAMVAWLCDTNTDNLAALARRYPRAKPTTMLADLLDDPALDCVFIATPAATHYDIGRQVLEAGKHVLIEKPLTTSSSHAVKLIELAERKQKILMTGHVFEYNPAIRAVGDLLKSGELGEVYYMHFERTNLGPVRTDVNALWDLAAHDAAIMCDLLDDLPASVTARGQAYLNPGVEDVVFATFDFERGVTAHVYASWLNPRKQRQVTVVGSRKMVVCDDLDLRHPIRLYDKRVTLPVSEITGTFLQHKTLVVDAGTTVPVVQSMEPLLAEVTDFFHCIAAGSRPRADGISGWRVVRMMEAAMASMARNSILVPVDF
jgi:predicted dehydrogenase